MLRTRTKQHCVYEVLSDTKVSHVKQCSTTQSRVTRSIKHCARPTSASFHCGFTLTSCSCSLEPKVFHQTCLLPFVFMSFFFQFVFNTCIFCACSKVACCYVASWWFFFFFPSTNASLLLTLHHSPIFCNKVTNGILRTLFHFEQHILHHVRTHHIAPLRKLHPELHTAARTPSASSARFYLESALPSLGSPRGGTSLLSRYFSWVVFLSFSALIHEPFLQPDTGVAGALPAPDHGSSITSQFPLQIVPGKIFSHSLQSPCSTRAKLRRFRAEEMTLCSRWEARHDSVVRIGVRASC